MYRLKSANQTSKRRISLQNNENLFENSFYFQKTCDLEQGQQHQNLMQPENGRFCQKRHSITSTNSIDDLDKRLEERIGEMVPLVVSRLEEVESEIVRRKS